MAVNCLVPLTVTLAVAGVTVIDVSVGGGAGAVTVKVTVGLLLPERDAPMVVVPAATPVAKPEEEIVAVPGLELTHVTCEEISLLEPSE